MLDDEEQREQKPNDIERQDLPKDDQDQNTVISLLHSLPELRRELAELRIKIELSKSELFELQETTKALREEKYKLLRENVEMAELKEMSLGSERAYQGNAYRDTTTRRIAIIVLSLLAATILVHYAMITAFTYTGQNPQYLQSTLNTWLPFLTGLVSGVVGYYFSSTQSSSGQGARDYRAKPPSETPSK